MCNCVQKNIGFKGTVLLLPRILFFRKSREYMVSRPNTVSMLLYSVLVLFFRHTVDQCGV